MGGYLPRMNYSTWGEDSKDGWIGGMVSSRNKPQLMGGDRKDGCCMQMVSSKNELMNGVGDKENWME